MKVQQGCEFEVFNKIYNAIIIDIQKGNTLKSIKSDYELKEIIIVLKETMKFFLENEEYEKCEIIKMFLNTK